MMRLPRVFEGPWAWMACGALTLLGIAAAANIPAALRSLDSRPAGQAAAPTQWVADASQYPPALLRLPDRISPAELGDPAAAARQGDSGLAGEALRAAGYSDREPPQDSEVKSVLRRLPDVVTPLPQTSGLTIDEWLNERLPEIAPPVRNGTPNPSTSASPDGGQFAFPPAATAGPGLGGEFRNGSPVPVIAPPTQTPQNVERQIERAPRAVANPRAMRAVSDRANELSRHGFSLAQRGALYSARTEFVQALRLITQALDAERDDGLHITALAAGLAALEEADDFVPKGSQLEANLNVATIAVSHQTPVLKDAKQATPLAAVQKYYTYAQEQLATAGGGQPAASAALYGLGRMHLALSNESVDARRLSGPKALTMHQAALLVDPRNFRAANELGVLLARYGQLTEAKRVLLVGLAASRQREAWHNLAVVHERLGEIDLAKRARHEEQLLAAAPNPAVESDSLVRWVGVKEFAATSNSADSAAPAPAANAAAAPHAATATKPAEKKAGYFGWPWK